MLQKRVKNDIYNKHDKMLDPRRGYHSAAWSARQITRYIKSPGNESNDKYPTTPHGTKWNATTL